MSSAKGFLIHVHGGLTVIQTAHARKINNERDCSALKHKSSVVNTSEPTRLLTWVLVFGEGAPHGGLSEKV